ncbi:MAG TPA: hypothetical protein VLZ78_05250 [Terrimesophilobacter sp.]|nr:hypothetical protein [Terrimesophilobacter sp.]
MNRPSIRLEKSAGGVRVRCSSCSHWHAFALSMSAAHTSASAHEANVHPGEYRARNAAKMYASRHPEKCDTPTRTVNV